MNRWGHRQGCGVNRSGVVESESQLLIHTCGGDLAKISRGKVEQFGWLVQAVADSQCFYHLA